MCLLFVQAKRAGTATVNDIRELKYADGEISYKLRHPHEWTIMHKRPVPTRGVNRVVPPAAPLYTSALKITKDKFKHLQELKTLLPLEYHAFYDALPHD
jgi:hypothetical protein